MSIVAMCLGLRISEVVGLQWGDFDWGQLQVMVQRSVVLGVVGEVILFNYKRKTAPDEKPTDWVFAKPLTGRSWRPG